MIKTFFLFLLFLGFDCFATTYGKLSNNLIFAHPQSEAETIVVGKVVYEDDEAFIEVYESWKKYNKRIRISRGKYKNDSQPESAPGNPYKNEYGELPPKNQIIYFAHRFEPSYIVEPFSIFKWNTFSTFESRHTIWSPVNQKKLKELHGKLGFPKHYPNGKSYQIPKEVAYFPFESNFSNEDILKDGRNFEEVLLNAKTISIGIAKELKNDIYLEVLKSWTSNDRILYLSHGIYDKNKERPMDQDLSNPHWYFTKKVVIVSYESPERLSKPLKRIQTPQDNFPEYDFTCVNLKNTIIYPINENDIKRIESILGKPKYDFESKK